MRGYGCAYLVGSRGLLPIVVCLTVAFVSCGCFTCLPGFYLLCASWLLWLVLPGSCRLCFRV